MNKTLPKILFNLIFFIFLSTVCAADAFAAPSIQFNQTSVSVVQNATFQIKVNINSETNAVIGSDAIINYVGNDLEVVSVTNGGYFPEFNSANNISGRLELHGYTSSTNDSRTGAGVLATIEFKSKKGSGSSAITFSCSGSGNDTNMLTTAGQNILTCTQTNTAGISYSGTTSTNTPTPTSASGYTPTPTQPNTGNTSPVCSTLYTDIASAVGTPQTITLTCSGSDPGGYLNAAEFVFGDGTTQRVDKNAGSPGSISTSHTYTSIGTMGVSCKLRDNDGIWSSTPDSCKKVVSIKPGATPSPTRIQTRSYGDKGITTTVGVSGPTPTPTRIVVSIISDTPEPTKQDEENTVEPTLYPEEDTKTSSTKSNNIWWIIGGIVAIILAFLLLRRKGPPPPPSGQIPLSSS